MAQREGMQPALGQSHAARNDDQTRGRAGAPPLPPQRQPDLTGTTADAAVDEAIDALRQRQMVLPALLFLAGHRPLAFALGQMLLVLQPLAAILGADGLAVWGTLLSQPAGPAALMQRLTRLLDEDGHSTGQGDLMP